MVNLTSWKPLKQNRKHQYFFENERNSTIASIVSYLLLRIFIDLKNISSDHTSLYVVSSTKKHETYVDPYFAKTLMEEYYSKTLCRKDVGGTEV